MKKFLAVVLALAMVLAFAACTKAPAADEQKEVLVMGTAAAFPPYEYTTADDIVGIDPEIAQAIADKLGMELQIKDMEFDSLIAAVSGGSIDVVLAGMTVTEERLQSVNFSTSYAKGVQSIIVPENSDIKTADDLKNHKIGVQAGTTGDIYCTGDFGQDNVKQFTNGSLAVEALNNGQVDCVVIDNEPAKNYVAANEGLKILETAYTEEDYAIAIAKGNEELLQKVNKALDELKADGTLDKIISKYIK